jgi:Family of unknown function (DUF6152)
VRACTFSSLVGGILLAFSASAAAHHSFAIFDVDHPLQLSGTVKQFKFVSPHATIVLEVRGGDGRSVVWTLEGTSPSTLARDGWSSQSLVVGNEITITIDPLRSGSPGGAWTSQKINFRDGRPVACCTSDGF